MQLTMSDTMCEGLHLSPKELEREASALRPLIDDLLVQRQHLALTEILTVLEAAGESWP